MELPAQPARRVGGVFRRGLALVLVAISLQATSLAANTHALDGWSLAYQTGVMTDGRASEALNPTRVQALDSYLAGVVVGYDYPLGDSRFSVGVELQANYHFGDQSFYEIVVPVVLRYRPEDSWWDAFSSFAFGLGGSHYSEISNVERDNYGQSRRDLVYWFLEAEFATSVPSDTLFARLHHRSNAYDWLEPNGGSNALVVGFRRAF